MLQKIVLEAAHITIEETQVGTIMLTATNDRGKFMYEMSPSLEIDHSRCQVNVTLALRNVTPPDDDIPL